jgi:hypothetical protein
MKRLFFENIVDYIFKLQTKLNKKTQFCVLGNILEANFVHSYYQLPVLSHNEMNKKSVFVSSITNWNEFHMFHSITDICAIHDEIEIK